MRFKISGQMFRVLEKNNAEVKARNQSKSRKLKWEKNALWCSKNETMNIV